MEMKNVGDPKPVKPEEPKPGECCGEGCRVCVWDTYQSQLDKYMDEIKSWEERQSKQSDTLSVTKEPTSVFVPLWRYVPIANKLAPTILKHLR